jgi:hypothetical protein
MMTLETPVLSQAEKTIVCPLLSRLQERAQRLEEEATALRNDVTQMAQALDQPVATYVVDGEEYRLTAREVAAVRDRLIRPRPESVIRELALEYKIAERHRSDPPDERERRFWENIEAIRAQAIANGTAIDDPMEAVSGD